jgi:hypothetical protein
VSISGVDPDTNGFWAVSTGNQISSRLLSARWVDGLGGTCSSLIAWAGWWPADAIPQLHFHMSPHIIEIALCPAALTRRQPAGLRMGLL